MLRNTLDAYRSYSQQPNQLLETFKDEYLKQVGANWMSFEAQQSFLALVIQDYKAIQFPVPSTYTTKCLKYYIELIEKCKDGANEDGINDELIEEYTRRVHEQVSDGLETSHRIFAFKFDGQNDYSEIVIRVKQRFVNVGLSMWESGYLLGEFILSNPDLFHNKTCIELGSGIGLSGICLLHKNNPKPARKVYLTDYQDVVLSNCNENLKINDIDTMLILEGQDAIEDGKSAVIKHLDWKENNVSEFNADVLIAADVAYDIDVIEGLVNAYYAIAKRLKTTFEYFQKECEEDGITITDITEQFRMAEVFPYQDKRSTKFGDVRLYSIGLSTINE
ncbi:hypothetical protein AKO1_012652 [Acrasis kona]|uniref:FAM86 N-terminal domain-containing protein n=1 Tax=Acrasis kona TaxID=1008807 RepID=A0AAW2YX03_9EUKA